MARLWPTIVTENIYISSMTYFSSFYVQFQKENFILRSKIYIYYNKLIVFFYFIKSSCPQENRIWKFFFSAEINF